MKSHHLKQPSSDATPVEQRLRVGATLVLAGLALLCCSCQSMTPLTGGTPLAGPTTSASPPAPAPIPTEPSRWVNPAWQARALAEERAAEEAKHVQPAQFFHPEGSPYAAGWGHHLVGPGGMLPQPGPPPLPFGASGPECKFIGDPLAMHPDAIPGDQAWWSPPGLHRPWPHDEYIADGGDNPLPVAVQQDFTVLGLDEEDTVVHYDTLDGRTLVCESNKVCIYSPRFAAVRQVSGSVGHETWDRLAGTVLPLPVVQQEEILGPSTKLQRLQPIGELGLKRVNIFRDRLPAPEFIRVERLAAFDGALKPFEDFTLMRLGQVQMDEGPRLAEAIVAAKVWEIEEGPQVLIDEKAVIVQTHDAKPQETVLVEEPPPRPKMCITKIASTPHAQPGDIIEFTLRFDNLGNQMTGNVTILDNLTPRLEYIPNSAQCSLPAKFFTQENESGSLVLRWEIDEPLNPGEGGLIRFKCRVR